MKINNFFKNNKVLVCGASGMTGHNLYNYLKESGVDVGGTTFLKPIKEFITVDFTSIDNAISAIKNIDYVFICCAKTYNSQTCIDNPQSMILPNIQMVSNILEACLRNKVKRVLYISSATVYQPSFKILSEEDLDLNKNPSDIYMGIGWVKRYIEKLCEFYIKMGLEIIVVRPTNIYGRYDKNDEKINHVVPAFINRALKKEDVFNIKGNGLAVKDFIYVDDLVRDMLKIFTNYLGESTFNLCSCEETTILSLAEQIKSIVGNTSSVECTNTLEKVPYKRISRTKFDSLYGKEKYLSLREGLERTIKWFY
jgi:nucleoside-diphosphate-sugar epimerase